MNTIIMTHCAVARRRSWNNKTSTNTVQHPTNDPPGGAAGNHHHQEEGVPDRKLPVIVFLHGESFEWNGGNPYDGTVLASYAELIVVTLNYRLGILGE